MKALRDGYPHMALQNGLRINYNQAQDNKEWKEALFHRMKEELMAVQEDDRQGIIEMMDLLEAYALANGWSLNILDKDRILWEEQCGSFSGKLIEATQNTFETAQVPEPSFTQPASILEGKQGQKLKRKILESPCIQERELYHIETLERKVVYTQVQNEAHLATEA